MTVLISVDHGANGLGWVCEFLACMAVSVGTLVGRWCRLLSADLLALSQLLVVLRAVNVMLGLQVIGVVMSHDLSRVFRDVCLAVFLVLS